MRVLKWVLTGVVVLLVAVVIAGVAILKTLDLNQYRELIVQQLEAQTGREVAIAGPIDLEVSLSPALALSDVTLSNVPGGSKPQMLAVKRFEAKVALVPLLSRKVQVERIVLSGADILLETDAQGAGNWVFRPAGADAGQPAPEPSSPAEGSSELSLPAFDDIEVENSILTYRNGQNGNVTTVQVEKLRAEAPDASQPLEIALKGNYNGNPVEAEGTVGPLANLLEGAPAAIDFKLAAAGATMRLIGDLGKTGAEKGTNVVVTAEGSELGQLSALAGTPIPALGPYKASLRIQDDKGVLWANAIDATLGREDLALAHVTGAVANLAKAEGLDLRVQLKGASLAKLNQPAKLNLPAVGPYQLDAHVSGGGKTFKLGDLAAHVGGSDLAGNATLSLAGPRPQVEASLSSKALTLSDLTGATAESGGGSGQQAAKGSDGRVFPAEPLPLEGLKAVDANIGFTGETLTLDKVKLQNVKLTARLKDGRLLVEPLQAGVSGGSVTIKADLDAAPATPTVKLAVTSRQVEVGSLLRLLQVSDVLSGGKADLDLDVTGAGSSVRAVMAGLNGTTRLVMGPGRINNGFAKLLLADLVGMLTFSGDGDSSNINCMVSDFAIAKGQARAKALVLDTNGATILGSGGIDLANERLDLRFDPSAKQTNLANLAVPVRVGGTLAKPSVTPDPGKIAQNLVGTVVNTPQSVFGALASLTGQKAQTAEQNPCAVAVSSKAQPAQPAAQAAPAPASSGTAQPSGAGGALEGVVKGLGGSLDSLFGGTGSSSSGTTRKTTD